VPTYYCDPEDLPRFGVNADALAGLSIDERIRPKIRQVSDEMNGYFRSQFTLPLLVWGDDVRGCAAVMAAWEVLRVRGLKPGEDPEDNALRLAYVDKLSWLRQIAGGNVRPGVTDSSAASSSGTNAPAASAQVASNEQRGWFSRDPADAGPFTGRRG